MQKKLKERMVMFMVEIVGKEINKWMWYSQEKERKLKEEAIHD